MEYPKQSRITTGSHTHLISNQTVDLQILDVQPLTQDGGNFLDLMGYTSSMRKERFLKFKTRILTQMLKTEIYKLVIEETMSDNNGALFTLMNSQSQRRVNLMKILVSMSKETSTLFHKWDLTDILI